MWMNLVKGVIITFFLARLYIRNALINRPNQQIIFLRNLDIIIVELGIRFFTSIVFWWMVTKAFRNHEHRSDILERILEILNE